ncbi:MAG: ComF family protein [Spirochaetaceae bacterium]|nr:ComF family protein [Spirochaetaceae bacterium]
MKEMTRPALKDRASRPRAPMGRVVSLFRECLFPAGCAVCGDTLFGAEEAWYGLCCQCMGRFGIEDERRCLSCGRPLISEQERCLPCREGEGFSFDGAFALWPYAGNYRKLLGAYKFGKTLALGNFLAQKMTDALPLFYPFTRREDGPRIEEFSWVPVPPRYGKIKNSGWDQIDCLAGKLRKNHGVRIDACLERLPSQTQKNLGRQGRRVNLLGRIRCRKPPPDRVLLFDDVITTGSTLDVCAKTLKESGAKEVFAFALFYD